MKRTLLPLALVVILASCTHIVAKNYPGVKQDKLPPSWAGTYTLKFPSFLGMLMETANDTSTVIIDRDKITWITEKEANVYSLSDSLRYTLLGKDAFICLHNSHDQYTIFKVKKSEEGLDLFGLTADDGVEIEKLKPYFNNITEPLEEDDEEDMGIKLYEVNIDDKKLEAYYQSGIPSSDPIKLIRK